MKTFKCQFGQGVACEMQVTDAPPAPGSNHMLKVEWEGRPSRRVLRPYVAWVNSVNKTLADEWGIKMMHVFQIAPGTLESWVYEPGRPPKRVLVPRRK